MKEPRPRGRPRTFERDTVLDQSLDQFWRRGFDGTSLADLTAASGCTAPTIYALFGSKEGLFEEALRRYIEKAFQARADLLLAGPSDRSALEALLRTTVEATTSADHPPGCLILTSGLVGAGAPAEAIVAFRKAIFDGLVAFLDRARDQGHLGPCNVPALARYYFVVLQGIASQAVDGATREELSAVIPAALAAWPLN